MQRQGVNKTVVLSKDSITSFLIDVISSASSRYGDKLIDFMSTYHHHGLMDASPNQLFEYIENNNLLEYFYRMIIVRRKNMSDELSKTRQLSQKQNDIYSAVISVMNELATDEIEPDMELIGEVADLIQGLMEVHGITTCFPSCDENEVECCDSPDRCSFCKYGGTEL